MPLRPIILITGANGGLGFGICQRLLFQLSRSSPPDASLHGNTNSNSLDSIDLPCDGLTLIMACRSEKRAQAARTDLLARFNEHVKRMKKEPGYDGLAEVFQKKLVIDIRLVDLSMMSTVLAFGKEIRENYPYISHAIFNAGIGGFTGIDWWVALRQVWDDGLVYSVTAPKFYLQNQGDMSLDGLGWVWQSNVFSHFVLFREIEPLLFTPQYDRDSRVVWLSSLEASPDFFNADDWQCKQTQRPYESSKYQIQLIAGILDEVALAAPSSGKRVRHFVTEPGICSTSISDTLIGPILDLAKVVVFYIARFFGSVSHPILAYTGAASSVWLTIVSLAAITFAPLTTMQSQPRQNGKKANGSATNGATHGSANGSSQIDGHVQLNGSLASSPVPILYQTQTDWWGYPRLAFREVKGWRELRKEAIRLVQRCDDLYDRITGEKDTNEWINRSESASEKM